MSVLPKPPMPGDSRRGAQRGERSDQRVERIFAARLDHGGSRRVVEEHRFLRGGVPAREHARIARAATLHDAEHRRRAKEAWVEREDGVDVFVVEDAALNVRYHALKSIAATASLRSSAVGES